MIISVNTAMFLSHLSSEYDYFFRLVERPFEEKRSNLARRIYPSTNIIQRVHKIPNIINCGTNYTFIHHTFQI